MAGPVPRGSLADVLKQLPDQSPHCQQLPARDSPQPSALRIRTQEEGSGRLPQTMEGRRCPKEERAASSRWLEGGQARLCEWGESPLPLPASQPCRSAWGLRWSWRAPRSCLVISGKRVRRKSDGRQSLQTLHKRSIREQQLTRT